MPLSAAMGVSESARESMTRVSTLTSMPPSLTRSSCFSSPVTVTGWVETVRDQKKVQFVVLRDETGALQLVRPRTAADVLA